MTVQPTRDQLRALANAATPGPWENTWNGVQQSFDAATRVGEYAWEGVGIVPEEYVREHDAEFIAAARTAVPQLLDQLDQAEARIKAVEDALDQNVIVGRFSKRDLIYVEHIRRALDETPLIAPDGGEDYDQG